MVYISTPALANSARAPVMQAQAALAKAQQELSTGKLADIGLGLGAGSSGLVSLEQQQNRLQAISDSNTVATTRLTATTSAINSLQTTATNFLSVLATATTSGTSAALQTTAQSNLGALANQLNTAVSGQSIFGGINTGAQPITPYTMSPPSANKTAVDGALNTYLSGQGLTSASQMSGTQMQSFLNGPFAALFSAGSFNSTTGGAWSSATDQVQTSQISTGQTADTSVSANSQAFRQLAEAYTMVTEFGSSASGGNSAAGQAVVSTATSLISAAVTGLTALNTGVGITQSSISDANDQLTTQINLISSQVSTKEGVDTYALTTQVSSLQTQIQASYELTAKLQQMSLVSYINGL